MNKELIQKFLNKACWDEQAQHELEDWLNVEKFAELIVRECLSYAKDGDLDFMKFMIKKNFGVEE
jgi:hypothetical protein